MFLAHFRVIMLVAAIDPDCQALIDANSQSLDLIAAIQANYTIASIDDPKDRPSEIWWSRDGRRERIRYWAGNLKPTADGRPRDIRDLVLDGDSYKLLQNWDPANPQRITPLQQGTVRASTGPQTNTNVSVAPSRDLLLEVDANPRRTLRELASISPKTTCKGKVQIDGRELWLLSLETPEETTPASTKRYFDVYLDPHAAYMVRKVIITEPNVMQSSAQATKLQHAHEVVEFKDFGDGIFVATRIRNGTIDKWMSEIVVKSVKVNEPIPPETFEMDWPKYAQVVHFPPVNGKLKVEVWGDDKPIQEIKQVADLPVLEAELRKDPRTAAELGPEPGTRPPPPMATLTKLFISFVALLVLMIGLVIWRRIREQAAA